MMFTEYFSVKYVFAKTSADTWQTCDIFTQTLDFLHLFLYELRLQPVRQLHKHYTEQTTVKKHQFVINFDILYLKWQDW